MRTIAFTTLLVITTFCYSQVILTINSLDSITRNTIVFNGQIQNNTNELKEIVPLYHDCNNNVSPSLWEIQITRNGLTYTNPFDIIVLPYNPTYKNFWKIKKEKTYKLTFCVDFSKLAPIDNKNKTMVLVENNYINKDFGKYSVRLLYNYYKHEKNKVNELVSNDLVVEYCKQNDEKIKN